MTFITKQPHIVIVCLLIAGLSYLNGQTDPTNVACSTVSSSSLTITWTQASDVSVLGYNLDIERTDNIMNHIGLPSLDLPDRTYESYTYGGLGFYGGYTMTIHSYFSGGVNGTDFDVTCTTSEDLPGASNFGLECAGASYYTISCTWTDLETVYWNGAPLGYQLSYLALINSDVVSVDFSTTTFANTISGLDFDTHYIVQIRAFNSIGHGPYSSSATKTLGFATETANETRYYCYQAVAGTLEFGWLEMPCTIYTGTIAGLLILCIILMIACCCKGGGGGGKSKTDIKVNIADTKKES